MIPLQIVEVEFAIRVLSDPKVRMILVGDRRQSVDSVLRLLNKAKQHQIDGWMDLDERHVRGLLRAIIEVVPWMRDLLLFRFDDDEQT